MRDTILPNSPVQSRLCRAALMIASGNFHVFPCKPDKRPLLDAWDRIATTNPDTIAAWWGRYPNALIGCIPGRNGYVVLDCDTPGAPAALAAMGVPVDGPAVTTGRGVHLWFKKPAGMHFGNSRSGLPDGVDVRGDAGYVILPPSSHPSGGRYRFSGKPFSQIQELPASIATLLHSPTTSERLDAPAEGATIREGGRDNELFRIARTLRANGCGYAEILAAVEAANAERCVPPLSAEDVERIARSAARYTASPDARDEFEAVQGAAPPSPKAAKVVSFAELARNPKLLEPPKRVGNLTWEGRISQLWAAPKSGKSTVATAEAASITQAGGTVLWVSHEEAPGDYVRRASRHGAVAARMITPVEPLTSFEELAGIVAEHRPRVIIVDSLSSSIPALFGEAPETFQSDKWFELVGKFRILAGSDRAVLLLHHSVRAGNRYAGSFGIGGAVDQIIELARPADGNSLLHFVGRWAEDSVPLMFDADTETIRFATSAELRSALRADILTHIRAGVVTNANLARVMRKRSAVIGAAVAHLEAVGAIRRVNRQWAVVEAQDEFKSLEDNDVTD